MDQQLQTAPSPQPLMRKAYVAPSLTLFGQVAALTQNSACSAINDGSASCQSGATGMGPKASDRRLKEDLVRVGEHPAGFGLYLYRYKAAYSTDSRRQFGVIADEVEAIFPQAVEVGADGFKRVHYDMIGVCPAH